MRKRRTKSTIVFLDDKYASLIAWHLLGDVKVKKKIENLSVNLAKSRGLWCDEIRFYTAKPYTSEPPTLDEIKRREKHEAFVDSLEKTRPRTYVLQGRCQKIGNEYHQKGVDTLLTKDLLLCSQRKVRSRRMS